MVFIAKRAKARKKRVSSKKKQPRQSASDGLATPKSISPALEEQPEMLREETWLEKECQEVDEAPISWMLFEVDVVLDEQITLP